MKSITIITTAFLIASIGFVGQSGAAKAQVMCNGQVATIVGVALGEEIHGGPGNDVIHGMGGNDRIYGEGGDDTICGGAGNDLLDGGDGNDNLDGQAGNDTYIGGPGNDNLADQGGGRDTADYGSSPAGVIVRLTNGLPKNDGFGGQDNYDNIENAYGSNFNDQLIGDIVANVILGRGGDDFMSGLAGGDTLTGGPGIDTANGGPGGDTCSAEVFAPSC